MKARETLERLEDLEGYIGYRAWSLAESDQMTREDLAQEAREAIIRTLKGRNDYPNSYLRKVANTAMLQYLSRGRSVDRPWPYCDRQRTYQVLSLDEYQGDGLILYERISYRRRRFEEATDARMMLDQLEPHLNPGQRVVFDLLRQGRSQLDIAEMLGRNSSQIYGTTRSIKKKARRVWNVSALEVECTVQGTGSFDTEHKRRALANALRSMPIRYRRPLQE